MSRLARAARVLRTVRHIRSRQLLAQARHVVFGIPAPVSVPRPPPSLALPEGEASGSLVPFLPAPRLDRIERRGEASTLCLLNRRVTWQGAIDWDATPEGPLFAYHMHQFDYLRGPEASPALRGELILDWIARHEKGAGWDPHPTALRILAWGRLLLERGALALEGADEERVRASLADQIETLSRGIEYRLQANHLLTNLVGVVFGGLLFEGPRADAWLRLWPALRMELRSQILPDGAHEERSPMYHSLLLEQVLDLLNLARAVPRRAPSGLSQALEGVAARMLGALDLLTHPDDEIALFCDSAFGTAPSPGELRRYADSLGIAPRRPIRTGLLPDAGYARLESGRLTLIASVAGPGPAHQPGHAHCDALSFELSLGGERIVADTGVYEYVPGALRDASRATLSHATIEVDGREQSEVWAAHRIGGRARVSLDACDPGSRIEASCSGWATPDTIHRRTFEVATGEAAGVGRLVITDQIDGRPRPVRCALPLAPGLEAALMGSSGEAQQLEITTRAGLRLCVELPAPGNLAWQLREMPCFPEFGRQESRKFLLGEGAAFRSGRWVFRAIE